MNKLKNLLKRLILVNISLLIALGCIFLQPFAVSAASLPSPFLGVNSYVVDHNNVVTRYSLSGSSVSGSGGAQGILDCNSLSSSGGCDIYTLKSGSSGNLGLNLTFNLSGFGNIVPVYDTSYTTVLDFVLDADYIGSFDLYIDNDEYDTVYVNGSTVSYTYIGLIPSVSVRNLTLSRKSTTNWDFPIESYSINNHLLSNYTPTLNFADSFYTYPRFNLKTNDVFFQGYIEPNRDFSLIFYVNQTIYASTVSNFFDIGDLSVKSLKRLSTASGPFESLYHIVLTSSINKAYNIKSKMNLSIVALYANFSDIPVSTDFALRYGLSNDLLLAIDTLVQKSTKLTDGTSDSNLAADDLNNLVDDKQDIMDETFAFEDQVADDLTSNLDDIDLPSVGSLTGLATGSFNFVSTQFTNLLTNSSGSLNPFGLSVMFILSIGLALLLIGKGIFK